MDHFSTRTPSEQLVETACSERFIKETPGGPPVVHLERANNH